MSDLDLDKRMSDLISPTLFVVLIIHTSCYHGVTLSQSVFFPLGPGVALKGQSPQL